MNTFISYPDGTARNALQLAMGLRAKGINTWCAEDSLTSGDDWKSEIREALKSAQVIIFVIAELHPSHWVLEEHMAALESYWAGHKTKFIPVVVGHAIRPSFLRPWRAVTVCRKSDLARSVNHVLQLLRSDAGPQLHVIKKLERERRERLDKITEFAKKLRRAHVIDGRGRGLQ